MNIVVVNFWLNFNPKPNPSAADSTKRSCTLLMRDANTGLMLFLVVSDFGFFRFVHKDDADGKYYQR